MLSVYRYLVVFAILVAIPVHAQTPTPTPTATPHPDALSQGLYEFEDLSAPDIQLSGAGWHICSGGNNSTILFLCSSTGGGLLEFYVTGIDYIIIQLHMQTTAGLPAFTLCVDGVCSFEQMRASSGLAGFGVDVNGNSHITITTALGNHRFDFVTLHPLPIDLSSISGTGSSATPTPLPYVVYDTISGVSGTVATRFDYVVTAGDVAVSSALLFLLFSLWSALLLLVVVRRNG